MGTGYRYREKENYESLEDKIGVWLDEIKRDDEKKKIFAEVSLKINVDGIYAVLKMLEMENNPEMKKIICAALWVHINEVESKFCGYVPCGILYQIREKLKLLCSDI